MVGWTLKLIEKRFDAIDAYERNRRARQQSTGGSIYLRRHLPLGTGGRPAGATAPDADPDSAAADAQRVAQLPVDEATIEVQRNLTRSDRATTHKALAEAEARVHDHLSSQLASVLASAKVRIANQSKTFLTSREGGGDEEHVVDDATTSAVPPPPAEAADVRATTRPSVPSIDPAVVAAPEPQVQPSATRPGTASTAGGAAALSSSNRAGSPRRPMTAGGKPEASAFGGKSALSSPFANPNPPTVRILQWDASRRAVEREKQLQLAKEDGATNSRRAQMIAKHFFDQLPPVIPVPAKRPPAMAQRYERDTSPEGATGGDREAENNNEGDDDIFNASPTHALRSHPQPAAAAMNAVFRDKSFYYLNIRLDHPSAALTDWIFTAVVTDVTDGNRLLRHTFRNLQVDRRMYLVFRPPSNTTFSPVDDIPWVAGPEALFRHTLRIEVSATHPCRMPILDTMVFYGDDVPRDIGGGETAGAAAQSAAGAKNHPSAARFPPAAFRLAPASAPSRRPEFGAAAAASASGLAVAGTRPSRPASGASTGSAALR